MITAIKIIILENMGNPRRAYELLRSPDGFLSMESFGYLKSVTFTHFDFIISAKNIAVKRITYSYTRLQSVFLNA